jgi:hypothetical protein
MGCMSEMTTDAQVSPRILQVMHMYGADLAVQFVRLSPNVSQCYSVLQLRRK